MLKEVRNVCNSTKGNPSSSKLVLELIVVLPIKLGKPYLTHFFVGEGPKELIPADTDDWGTRGPA